MKPVGRISEYVQVAAVLLAALLVSAAAELRVDAAAPTTEPERTSTAPATAPADALAVRRLTRARLLFTARVKEINNLGAGAVAGNGPQEITFEALEVLRGSEPASRTFVYLPGLSGNWLAAPGDRVIVGSTGLGTRPSIQGLVGASADNLKLARSLADSAALTRPAGVGAATQPAPSPELVQAAQRLIVQLGDDKYALREQATRELTAMGKAIVPVLQAKQDEGNLDPEIGDRIGRILGVLLPLEGATITDPATGITYALHLAGRGIEARRDNRLLWVTMNRQRLQSTALRLESGKLIALPSGWALNPVTGQTIEDAPPGGN